MRDSRKIVLTVLRSGGDFEPKHVQALQRQVAEWATGVEFFCLTDTAVTGVDCIPLGYDWPGWWAKMELFRPDIANYLGDFLYTDLDNVIVGPIDDLFTFGRYTTQIGGWTALTFIPATARAQVWDDFIRAPGGPQLEMDWFNPAHCPPPFGDAGFIARHLDSTAQRWEELFPGQVVNIVEMIRSTPLGPRWRPVPTGARVVLCATRARRPWNLPMFQHMY